MENSICNVVVKCKDCGKSMISDGFRPRCTDCRKTNVRKGCIDCGGNVYKFNGVWNTRCTVCYKTSLLKKK